MTAEHERGAIPAADARADTADADQARAEDVRARDAGADLTPVAGSMPPARDIGPRAGRGGKPRRPRRSSFMRELPVLIAIALVLALLIKAFLVQAFFIPSGSMEQTLMVGDRVLVNKLVYRTRDVQRGEIVVFKGPESWAPEVAFAKPTNVVTRALRAVGSAIGVAPAGEKDFIKRVIGIPGDTVACCDPRGRVTVNGVPLTEPYTYQDNHETFAPVKVPKGRVWVMGDHRSESADSRAHVTDGEFGTIPEKNIVGRAFVKVWPVSRVGGLSVPSTFHQKSLAADALGATPSVLGVAGALPVAALRRRRRRRRAAA